ncbi:MAG TPA: DUF3570 domain-containing protein [Polyangiaceae bacterium]|nr:DUF3570 domain-containing protein [Polyangiaceae bacterium]
MRSRRWVMGQLTRWFLGCLAAILVSTAGLRGSSAAPNDEDVEALVASVLETHYANKQFDEAMTVLDLASQACESREACSPKVRAKVYLATGVVLAGGLQRTADGKELFITALTEDPAATLFPNQATPEMTRLFEEAKKAVAGSVGSASDATESSKRELKKVWKDTGQPPPKGWRSAEAHFYFREAQASERKREWLDCADYAKASIGEEDQPVTRMLAAQCEESAGLWVEAHGDFMTVAEMASTMGPGYAQLASRAEAKRKELREKIPKLVLRRPVGVTDLVVKMNDVVIPNNKLGGELWINPGQSAIVATAKRAGAQVEFQQIVNVSEFEVATLDIVLSPKGARDEAVLKCILSAKSREDYGRCVGTGVGGSLVAGLNARVGLEVSGYHDTDSVAVFTPGMFAVFEDPVGGWGINGVFLVDVVTAASVDIVASASPRWTEVRYVPALGGHKKIDGVDVSLKGSMSIEPDYIGTAVGAGASIEVMNKLVKPSLGYDFGYDINARAGTSFESFSKEIFRHSVNASVNVVVNKAMFAAGSFSLIFEDGDTSKPYRHVPMFAPETAPRVPVGLSVEGVSANRLPERALEKLPTTRQRYALAGGLGYRSSWTTLRADERLYIDSWGLKASTTEVRYFMDVTDTLRVWPQLRFHAQTGVSFWKHAYVSEATSTRLSLPTLRTGDRELGPFFSAALGGGGRLALGEKKNVGLSLVGNVIYSRFLDHLFILNRIGYFGATTVEVGFE